MSDWRKAIESFKRVEVLRTYDVEQGDGNTVTVAIKIEWTFIGEGYSGDYQDDDIEDVPLLRFYVSKASPNTDEFEDVDDGSYCTLMPVNTPEGILERAANMILDDVAWNIAVESFYRRDLEEWSWVSPSWITGGAVIY